MDTGNKSITFQSITIPSLGRGGYTATPAGGLRAPMRCLRLFVFAFLVPCTLIAIPLYQRRVSLAPRLYTMTATDMRGVQDGISTVWCEAQELSSDTPFTSYRTDRVLPQRSRRLPVTLRHKLTLRDDVKEFWGFYLLRGSRISVSACARWPGTSLLLVQGWTALNDCVWVGQIDSIQEESSEEEDDDDDENEEVLDPVRKQWREFLRQHTLQVSQARGHTESSSQKSARSLLRTDTYVTPAQKDRPRTGEHPVLQRHAGESVFKEPDVPPESNPASVKHTKDMHAVTQLIQRAAGKEQLADERRYDPEVAPAASAGVTTGPTSRDGSVRSPSPRALRAPLTNDVIEREVQAGRQPRRAAAAGADRPISGRHGNSAPPAGRIIPLTYNGHRGRVNQSLAGLETSHSEMMSSFSSSEEALLNCAGVIVNQPLRAETGCSADGAAAAAGAAQLTVQVISDEYYYLVFSSENEVLPVDVVFDVMLEKTVYDVRGVPAVCTNSSACRVPLTFWSAERALVEYPVPGNASEAVWSEQYTVRSSCQPRGWLVAVFIVAALLSLFVCAFC